LTSLTYSKENCYIYGIRKLNTKTYLYVGSTSNFVESRIKRHINDARSNRHVNKPLQEFLNKEFGFIAYDVLEICDLSIRHKREQHWINFLIKKHHKLVNIASPLTGF